MRKTIKPLKTVNRVRKIHAVRQLNDFTLELGIIDREIEDRYIVCHEADGTAIRTYWSKLNGDGRTYECVAPTEGEATCECEGFAHGWSCRHIEATKALVKAGRI